MTETTSQDRMLPSRNPVRWGKIAVADTIFLLVLVVLQNAWVGDDAYITFRTIDNFLHGFGLRWNVAERVNSNTHPLWMFLNAGFFLLSKQEFFVSITVSVGVTLAAVLVLGFKLARSAGAAVLALTILAFSKAFVDFSTSGLENPLSHLIAVLFLYVYLSGELTPKRFLGLSLLAGLAICNRMDSGLLYLPALCHGLWRHRNLRGVGLLALGMLPFLAWEVFSIIYYGFPFPNTAYAKLTNGVAAGALVHQGLVYLLDSITRDPLTLPAIAAGIGLAVWRKDKRKLCVAGGILLYLAYTVRIGGDFMAGRFLTTPLVLSVGVIAATCQFRRWWQAAIPATAAILIGALATYPPVVTRHDYGNWNHDWIASSGVADERGYYFNTAGLLNANTFYQMAANAILHEGERFKEKGPTVLVIGSAGYGSYFFGPNAHLVDTFALGDPLLARLLPMDLNGIWRIGHFTRQVPDGYLDTLCTGNNTLRDEGLRQYYESLRRVTRGDLFDAQRWADIWNLNTGKYDHLLESYAREPMNSVAFSQISGDEANEREPMNVEPRRFNHSGIQVTLPGPSHGQTIRVRLAGNAGYMFVFCKGQKGLGILRTNFLGTSTAELRWLTATVPPKAVESGFDRITLQPLYGDGSYAIAGLILSDISADDWKARLGPAADKPLEGEGITEWLSYPTRTQVPGHPNEAQWTWPKSDYVDSYHRRGAANLEKGKSSQAIHDFTKAIELEPGFATSYLNRGSGYLGLGELDLAVLDFTKAIELDPNLPEAHHNRGTALLEMGKTDLSIQEYTKAIELKPNYPDTYAFRAEAYRRQNAFDKAWADVKTCRKLGGAPSPKLLEVLIRDSGRSE